MNKKVYNVAVQAVVYLTYQVEADDENFAVNAAVSQFRNDQAMGIVSAVETSPVPNNDALIEVYEPEEINEEEAIW